MIVAISKPRWVLIAVSSICVVAASAGVYAVIQSRSQAILDARRPKPPSAVVAAASPEAIAEGAHLIQIVGCTSCHGRDLTGRMLGVSGSAAFAPNLTIAVRRLTDADLDRAIRRGMRPDGATELAMPSHVYAAFTDAQTGAIIGYLRSLRPQGKLSHRPRPGFLLRANLAAGILHTETAKVAEAAPPLDAGARFATGRHLASLACGQCHGTDLAGGHGAPGPDLTVRGYYDRRQFHILMRTGEGLEGDMALMSGTARARFSHFTDGEIDAIFDYLNARDRLLSVRRPS